MDTRLHFVQTEISTPGFFIFLLPISAFDFQGDMLIEFSVEYLKTPKGLCQANIWGRPKDGTVRHFIYGCSVPAGPQMEERIVETLNLDAQFNDRVFEFINGQSAEDEKGRQ